MYLVLNKEDYLFDNDSIAKLDALLDIVEDIEDGPACLVTIGAGKKLFSTGFNLKPWIVDDVNALTAIVKMQKLLARFITLPIPTFCVVQGHAFAGGLLLALCHDFRIVTNDPKRKMCLSEINIGLCLPPSFSVLVRSVLTTQTARTMQLGVKLTGPEACEMGAFTGTFANHEDAEKQIAQFVKYFAPQGAHRGAMKVLKTRMFQEYIDYCDRIVFSPYDIPAIRVVIEGWRQAEKTKKQRKAKL